MVQFLFTTLTCLFHKKCNRLKARVIIYPYNHHVWLLSPEPMVVEQPNEFPGGWFAVPGCNARGRVLLQFDSFLSRLQIFQSAAVPQGGASCNWRAWRDAGSASPPLAFRCAVVILAR